MKTLNDVGLAGKTVFLRCELNVAIDPETGTPDYTRIRASEPTIQRLRTEGARVVICSHMGRPWGKRDPEKSLRQLVQPLESVLGAPVLFTDDCVGSARDDAVAALGPGQTLLLENVRYYAEENANDPSFGAALVRGVDVYVNDAFGNCHRPHASMVAAALAAPERCAGLLLERELHELELINRPEYRPTLGIIGGAKVSGKDGKIHVVRSLLARMDQVAVVGKLAYFFLLADGIAVGATLTADTRGIDAPGASLNEDVDACRAVLEEARLAGKPILLPADSVVKVDDYRSLVQFPQEPVPERGRALDIGPATLAGLERAIDSARLVVWNGPAGYFEHPDYRAGTIGIAKALRASGKHGVIGGGDTVAAVVAVLEGQDNGAIHICTGGGAMLSWLMGAELPAVAALNS